MKYRIGDRVEATDSNVEHVQSLHLTPGKIYEVLGVIRGHVERDQFLIDVEDDRGFRRQIHESWFRYPTSTSNTSPAVQA